MDVRGFVVEIFDRFVPLDQVDASLRVLRVLVMKVRAMFCVESRIESNVVIA